MVFSSFHVTNYGLKIEVNNSQKESLLTVEKESKEEVYEPSSKKAMSWKKGAQEISSGRWLLWSFQVPYPSFHVLHSVEMQKNSPLWRPDRISLSLPFLWPGCWLPWFHQFQPNRTGTCRTRSALSPLPSQSQGMHVEGS